MDFSERIEKVREVACTNSNILKFILITVAGLLFFLMFGQTQLLRNSITVCANYTMQQTNETIAALDSQIYTLSHASSGLPIFTMVLIGFLALLLILNLCVTPQM